MKKILRYALSAGTIPVLLHEWQNVFQSQNLFEFESKKVFVQNQIGTVENVVSKRLLSTSFIATMPEAQQLLLKAEFEKIVEKFTGKKAQDQISFPYITYAFHFIKID